MRRARAAVAVIALTLAGAAPEAGTDFDRALQALQAGIGATDSPDWARLREAGLDLRASGAQPVAGADLADLWLRGTEAARLVERDRALGPGYRSLQISGGGSAMFEQTFLAGQLARVAIIPVHRSDYRMQVSDDDRTILCRAAPNIARCDWVPSFTTRFRIEISNPGRRAGHYIVMLQ